MKITATKCPFDIERLEREVNILFISDLHFDVDKNPNPDELDAQKMNELLVKSIADAGDDWAPDIVIVGGDLVNKGLSKNYFFYNKLISLLTTKYPNLRHTVFSTPGNHDVTRTDMTIMHPIIQKLHGLNAKKSHTANYTIGMFHTLSKRNITGPKFIKDFVKFESIYFKTYLAERANTEKACNLSPLNVTYPVKGLYTTYITSLLGINLVCHNTSFFCDMGQTGDDRNNLFLIRDLVDSINKKVPTLGPVICFMHHPYHFLHESEYIAPLEAVEKPEINNFSRILQTSDLVLSGHVHGELQDPTYQQHHAYIVTNGTSFTMDKWKEKSYPLTYAILKINKQGNWFAMKKFVHNRTLERFQLRFPQVSPHYPFSHRISSGRRDETSLETEKLRVVDYFINLEKAKTKELTYRFFIYQLALYDRSFKLKSNQKAEFEFSSKKSLGCDLTIIHRNTRALVAIYQINDDPYRSIKSVLEKLNGATLPAMITVYFSVNRAVLLTAASEPSNQKIDALWANFRSLILLSKKENVSVNLIYH